jgi:hypothetical protein
VISISTNTTDICPKISRCRGNIVINPKIVLQSKLLFMHSYHYSYAPPSFNNTWITNARHHPGVELRNGEDYYIPRPNLTLFTLLPLYSFPSAWNEAGPSKYHNNPILFKNLLKEELLSI